MYFSIKRIRDSYWTKGFSLLMGLNLLVQPLIPSVSYAITGGPSQPEFTQFSPVTADNVVDPYTGNFQYNIPLMTVPGPNGGYPINLSYASDVTMDQEASWVGLGWNVNVGAINRQLRGLPDDFDGDEVSKNVNLKDREVYSMDLSGSYSELFGSKFLGGSSSVNLLGSFPSSIRLFYDNYNGFGYSFGAGIPSLDFPLTNEIGLSMGLGLNLDSQGGVTYSPDFKMDLGFFRFPEIGASLNTRSGIEAIRIAPRTRSAIVNMATSVSFPIVDNVPNVGIQTTTETDKIALNIGVVTPVWGRTNYPLPLIMNKTTTSLASSTFTDHAYGYLNTEKASDQSLTDFQTSGNIMYNKKVPNLDPSILTYDIFNVSGQGMSGVFRAYRNEVAVYSQEESITSSEATSIETEAGGGVPGIHLGLGIAGGGGNQRSGSWQEGTTSVDGLDHEGKQSPEDEPYSFVMISEKNVQRNQEDILDDWNADDPVRVRLGEYNGWANKKFEADQIEAHSGSSFLYNPTTGSSNKRTNRIRRETSIKALKGDEVYDFGFSKYVEYYDKGTGTWIDKEMTGINRGHHINEYSITQTDGSVYTYGLPAYNQTRVDANFRVEENAELDLPTSQTGLDVQRITKVKVPVAGGSIDPQSGTTYPLDQFVSETTTPEYVHSWLLTSVVGHDYADITGDGPSDDDLGYWVKFSYEKAHSNYKWREPYADAHFNAGMYSSDGDNSGTFTYGEKEIFYVKTVETKTHIAVFELGDRRDGVGVSGKITNESNALGNETLKYIKTIKLYVKEEYNKNPSTAIPIKTAHFRYSYDLCSGIPSNNGLNPDDNLYFESEENEGGKLTLKKVFFTYRDSDRGKLNKYEFDYGDNPSYDQKNVDAWGFYKNNDYTGYSEKYNHNLFPYTDPYTDTPSSPSAWNLDEITMPNGSVMSVEYESDDYSYVQDKATLGMFDILGVYKYSEIASLNAIDLQSYSRFDTDDDDDKTDIKGNYIFFKPLDGSVTDYNDVYNKYLIGLDHIYFKGEVNLLKDHANEAKDRYEMVDGFAELDINPNGTTEKERGYGVVTTGGTVVAFVKLKPVEVGRIGAFKENPIRSASLQHLNLKVPELKYGEPVSSVSAEQLVSPFLNIAESVVGKYKLDMTIGRCSSMKLNGRSQIRLKYPNGAGKSKKGGGSRVHKILIEEKKNSSSENITGFDTPNNTYGQVYEYTMEDGTSSGVAYEPMVGMEQSALVVPEPYSQSILEGPFEFVVKKPIMMHYYPSQSVGYRRVLVRSINHKKVEDQTASFDENSILPVTEYRFYTPKEFPVFEYQTDLTPNKKIVRPINLPGMSYSTIRLARSQGYSVILNDMAGKPRSVASYILGDGIKKQLSSTIYHYKTEDDYDPNKVNKLTNQVSCLTDDQGSTEEVTLGRNEEIFFVLNENSSLNHELGLDLNLEVGTPLLFAIIPIPHGSYSEMSMKTAVGHKIIRKSGVLDHVEVWDGQSRVVTRNKYFDLETGSPIVTEVINEHEDPVVSFNYPGNWSYDHLGGAYQNVLAEFSKYTMPTSSFANMSGNDMVFTGVNVEDYFVEGDEVFIEGSSFANLLAHVIEVDDVANSILCVEKDGDLISSALTGITKVTIVNSGRKNMQSVSTGGIVSLGEIPFKNILPPIFKVYNEIPYDGTSMYGNIQLCDGTDLGPENKYTFTTGSNIINITVNAAGETCTGARISCTDCGSDGAGFMTNAQDVTITSFDPLTNQVTYTIIDQYGVSHDRTGILSDVNGCVESCFKGVLQASAVEFTDDWSINCLANSCGFTEADAVDPYAIGLRGSWRPFKSYAYVTDRENNGDIREDGLFEDFAFYDWNDPASVDDKWRNASEITKYSPYGFEVENVNAIGNYSAAIYGYGGSLPIAVAQNARYNEALYDGFEDYSMLINDGCEVEEHHWTVPAVGNITDEEAHTGNYSFKQTSGTTSTTISLSNPDCTGDNTSESSGQIILEDCGCNGQFNPYNGSLDPVDYYVSVWVKQSGVTAPVNGDYSNANLQIKVDADTYSILPTDVIIEGWQKLEGYVTIEPGASSVIIYFNNSYEVPADVYFDDFRIHPANANMGAFVYDPGNLQSTAQLDANNFATFFIYDDEGKLYQKKVETREGIKTIQVGRSAQIIE